MVLKCVVLRFAGCFCMLLVVRCSLFVGGVCPLLLFGDDARGLRFIVRYRVLFVVCCFGGCRCVLLFCLLYGVVWRASMCVVGCALLDACWLLSSDCCCLSLARCGCALFVRCSLLNVAS